MCNTLIPDFHPPTASKNITLADLIESLNKQEHIIDMTSPVDPDTQKLIDNIAAIQLRMQDKEMMNLKAKDKLEKEFWSFFEIYPSLFKQIYEEGDLEMLAQMLCAIDRIKSGQTSVEDAEKELDEQFAGRFLSHVKSKQLC